MSERQIFGKLKLDKIPYEGSQVDPEKSKSQMQKLLQKYGADPVQWTQSGDNIVLRFGIRVEVKGVIKDLAIELAPPRFEKKVKQWNKSKSAYDHAFVPDTKRGLRLLYFYLKSKLEAIGFGLVDAEKEFLSQIVVQLPEGPRTVGQLLEPIMAKGLESLPHTR